MLEAISAFEADRLLQSALAEDIGMGDITSLSTVAPDRQISGRYIAKEAGVLCGLAFVARAFALLDPAIAFAPLAGDGEAIAKGDVIATVSGNARAILMGERVGLNLLQHMSGRGLARIDDLRARSGHGGHGARRLRGHAGHVLQKVQPHALAREYGAGIAGNGGDHIALADAIAVRGQRGKGDGGVQQGKGARDDLQPAENAVFFGDVPPRDRSPGRDGGKRCDVAGTDVLGKGAFENAFHFKGRDVLQHAVYLLSGVSMAARKGRFPRAVRNGPFPFRASARRHMRSGAARPISDSATRMTFLLTRVSSSRSARAPMSSSSMRRS